MNKLIHVIKKDILMTGRYIWLIALAPVIYLGFVALVSTKALGLSAFILLNVVVTFMMNDGIDIQEAKYPNAVAMICSTPIMRKTLVYGRYCLNYLMFLYCYIMYVLLAVDLFHGGNLSGMEVLLAGWITSFVISIYMPLQYKFGLTGARSVLIGISLFISFFYKAFPKNKQIHTLSMMPGMIIAVILAMNMISISMSLGIMKRREL